MSKRIRYRITKRTFIIGNPVYVVQFRVLFIWLHIGRFKNTFFISDTVYLKTFKEAQERLECFKKENWREFNLFSKKNEVIYEE